MVTKAGNFFWTYERIPPQKLRFAVTYFPGASEFDPQPSEKQLEKEELIARDGWKLVLRWDAMQIFCTDREDAVPIETDPMPRVENIHRTMRKNIFFGQLVTVVLVLWSLYLQFSQLWRDPVEYLSDRPDRRRSMASSCRFTPGSGCPGWCWLWCAYSFFFLTPPPVLTFCSWSALLRL